MKNFVILYILLLVGCAGGAKTTATEDIDTLYAPRYAKHFVVLESGDSTILRVINPWQGAVGVSYDYVLGDARRMVCMSSSHTAFIDTLGEGSRIVGVSTPDYYTNARYAKLPDVGFDNSLNIEMLAWLSVDLMTAYALSSERSAIEDKLSAFGTKMIYVADYLEDDPLARAEWVVAFGAMVGRMELGQRIFEGVCADYNVLKDSVRRAQVEPCPVMLNSPYKGVWYLPGDSSYMVRLIKDAGGQYVAAGNADNVSHTISTEVAYSHLLKAKVWLNPSAMILTLADLRAESPLFGDLKIPVYNNNQRSGAKGGSDFWESGVIRPDVVLRDLVCVFHPELIEGHSLYYYKEVR